MPKAFIPRKSRSTCKPSSAAKTEIIADIRSRLAVLPLAVNVGQPISHRLDHMLSGVRAEIALKIFGDDLDTLRSTSPKALRAEARRQLPGLADLQVEKQVRIPQLEIRVDYGRAALYGVQPAPSSSSSAGCRTAASYREWSMAIAAST